MPELYPPGIIFHGAAMDSAGAEYGQFYDGEDRLFASRLIDIAYDDLLAIARQRRRRAQVSDTLQTVDVLHGGLMKLADLEGVRSLDHLLRIASLAMRQVVIDHARARLAAKRSGGAEASGAIEAFAESPEEIVEIGRLLDRLEQENPRWLAIVDARYFGGMTEDETAAMLGLSPRTVRRAWVDARGWLAARMGRDQP